MKAECKMQNPELGASEGERPGKAAREVAAFQEFMHHLGDDGSQDAVARLVRLGISRLELGVVAVGALPERRLFRIAGAIDLHWSTRQHKPDVCHLTAQVEKASLPRKSAKDAKREESTMEDIMKLCDVVRKDHQLMRLSYSQPKAR
jgi:hypothetical protein